MRRNKVRLLAALLTAALLLTGCGGRALQETIPELREPVAANGAYRPVELGTIGETKVLYGTVVPVEYCCFYETTAGIEKIAVEVGDYVEKGDIIAYADIAMAEKELESLQLQLENLRLNHEKNEKISQLQIAQIASREISGDDLLPYGVTEKELLQITVSGNDLLTQDVSGNDLMGREEAEKILREYRKALQERQEKKDADLATAQENLRYDGMLHEYRVTKLQEEISSKQRVAAGGILRASHSGYVIYVKNLGVNTVAAAYENIVLLADPEETCIELTGKTIQNYAYRDYEVKYLHLAGETYDVTELSYGAEAEALAKAREMYPNVRLTCIEGPRLTIGETYPILFREKQMEEVPIIGLDSLKGEEGAYYVYVKTQSGEREKRAVTIGGADNYYVQILSGLEAGEMVYYESEARTPADYTEYTVELSDYRIENISRTYELAEEQVVWYDAECEGTITELSVKAGDTVGAGDLLYVMRSDAGKAALAAALNDINRENTAYDAAVKKIDKSLAKETDENARKILILQKELEDINHAYRLGQLEQTYRDMAENNDGNGKICVYAKQSGTVARIAVEEDGAVTEGTHVLSIGNEAEDKLLVQMIAMTEERNYPDNIAEFGESITITVGEHVYQGTCIGRTAHRGTNLDKYYISETEDGIKISFCTESGYQNPAFYVKMEDESFYQNTAMGKLAFSYVSMEDVVVVPTAAVKEESNAKNPNRTDYYVWRIEGDEPVKQYVLIDKSYSDVNQTLILSGVEEKDVLALEK